MCYWAAISETATTNGEVGPSGTAAVAHMNKLNSAHVIVPTSGGVLTWYRFEDENNQSDLKEPPANLGGN